MRNVIWIWVGVAVITAVSDCAACAQDQSLREDVARRIVMIRLLVAETGVVSSEGSGLVIGSDGDSLTVLTAEHVIRPDGAREQTGKLQVRFRGSDWVNDGLTVLKEWPADGPDMAVLRYEGRNHPFPSGSLRTTLSVALMPDAEASPLLTVMGSDVDRSVVKTSSGRLERIKGSTVEFESDNVRPGWSGGMIVCDRGIVGMILQEGSLGRGHRALAMEAVVAELAKAGISTHVRQDTARSALQFAADHKLLLGLFIWDQTNAGQKKGTWAAIRLNTPTKNEEFKGDLLLYEHEQDNSGNVQFRAQGDSVRAQLPHVRLWGDSTTLKGFGPCTDVAVPGMLVLKAQAGALTAYLAVPVTRRELLGAALIRQSATSDWRDCQMTDEQQSVFELIVLEQVRCNGVPAAFPLIVKNNKNQISVFCRDDFSAATLTTMLRVPDAFTGLVDHQRRRYGEVSIKLLDATRENPVGEEVRPEVSGGRMRTWSQRFTGRTWLDVESDDAINPAVPLILDSAVLDYSNDSDGQPVPWRCPCCGRGLE